MNLPDVILKHLQSFLPSEDINYFVNSNKSPLASLKKETIYFSLNKKKSRKYVEDERFRGKVLSKVKDGRKQLGLKFDSRCNVPDIRDIAHKIDFSRRYPTLLNVPSQCLFLSTEARDSFLTNAARS